MKKSLSFVALGCAIITLVVILALEKGQGRYLENVISLEEWNQIIENKKENTAFFEKVIFNDKPLIQDCSNHAFYYSITESNKKDYNPKIKVLSEKNVQVYFLEKGITQLEISSNTPIRMLLCSEDEFAACDLYISTLPFVNIVCEQDIDEEVPIRFELVDNRKGTLTSYFVSNGKIKIRGATTRNYPKKSYKIKLNQESIGEKTRPNNSALLGMRQDNEWILYAAYNDQEKIRNVFSTNLWNISCANNNSLNINTGTEYQYVELFQNGQYWGLYALGTLVNEKQMIKNHNDYLLKKTHWDSEKRFEFSEENEIVGYEIKGGDQFANDNLIDYYYFLSKHKLNSKELLERVDVDNAIDFFLFVNLIQGLDQATYIQDESKIDSKKYFDSIKNFYLLLHKDKNKIKGIYIPWDMDITWGNYWIYNALNYTSAYRVDYKYNAFFTNTYFSQILKNNNTDLWEKIVGRYQKLREQQWSDETILQLLDRYEKEIFESGAYKRDKERWQEGSYCPKEDLSYFKEYVLNRLHYLDEFYYDELDNITNGQDDILSQIQYEDYVFGVNLNTVLDFCTYLNALCKLDVQVIIQLNSLSEEENGKITSILNRYYNDINVNGNELFTFDTVNGDFSFFDTESDPNVNFTMDSIGEINRYWTESGVYGLYGNGQELFIGNTEQYEIEIVVFNNGDIMDATHWMWNDYENDWECVR